ncbi:hypothetical protein Ahy_A03g010988 isoform F [Arachis hypogaea]|uniref:Uncharacterized protein n=1 Tax=Arachis hypogaea TaxID=3818 RepID=A0A445DP76_ARAHY|nr:hypothetical protein Ahy_B03g062655 isoform F [Arachis hypogaea]RYR64975.1 hypothetical protein Ahy_A03g010988 isoform F [Arachis hypogaea]
MIVTVLQNYYQEFIM